MKENEWHHHPVTLLGIDLAWGEKNPDGVAILRFPDGILSPPDPSEVSLIHGESALFERIESESRVEFLFIAIDAPTLGPNLTGARPVDRECSRLFRREEAGCHPVNRSLCPRPLQIAEKLERDGFSLSSDLTRNRRLLCEVYPHPAMIRFFGLPKTIKYKRGPVAARRKEFSRYQSLTREFVLREFSDLKDDVELNRLFAEPWKKDVEDQLDAFFSALIAWWHLRYLGDKSEVLGDEKTGAILLPKPSPLLSVKA